MFPQDIGPPLPLMTQVLVDNRLSGMRPLMSPQLEPIPAGAGAPPPRPNRRFTMEVLSAEQDWKRARDKATAMMLERMVKSV
jgi:hypothetical protein